MSADGVTRAEYLDPQIAPGLPWRDARIVDGRDPSLSDLVIVVAGDPTAFGVPIVPWPVTGTRALDPGTGVEGGITEGVFSSRWAGHRLRGVNEAVGGEYVLGFDCAPESADDPVTHPPTQVLLWHVNYHPDGGQLFASLDGRPFLLPLMPPGDSPDLARAVVARCDGSYALCILPGVWHDGAFPAAGDGRYLTRQGRVHARVSANLADEFRCLLRVPLR